MSSYRSLALGIALALVTLPLFGCGKGIDPRRVEVHGSITLDGEPVQEGSISFYPGQGNKGVAAGGDVLDGAYTISRAKGPMAGKNRVEIRSPYATGRTNTVDGRQIKERLDRIPAKYNRHSTLEVDVQAEKNPFDFHLKTQ